MKIPFIVQTVGSLIVVGITVGMAWQSSLANDANHDKLIQQNSVKQTKIESDVTMIRVNLSAIVANQENQAGQTERIIGLLERSLLPGRE